MKARHLGLSVLALTMAGAVAGCAAPAETSASRPLTAPTIDREAPAAANIDSFVIEKRISPAFDGRTFGAVGTYELIVANVTGSLDPKASLNSGIVGLDTAPVNAAGRVEYATQVSILRPVDPSKSSGNLVYEVINRSVGGIDLQGKTLDRQGIMEVLLPRGDVFVNAAWQGELKPGSRPPGFEQLRAMVGSEPIYARLPPALENGKPMVRRIRHEVEAINTTTGDRVKSTELPYPAAPGSSLTGLWRAYEADAPKTLPPGAITLADSDTVTIAPVPDAAIYDIFYDATGGVVSGVGFAVPRDLISYLRHDAGDGNARVNPLLGQDGRPFVAHTYAYGLSQSGRYLRMFLWQGFNEDAAGRPVFDGIVPIVAGARFGYMNELFSDAGKSPGELAGHRGPDMFPFAYPVLHDLVSGRTDGILKRCEESGTCPKVMQIDSEQESANAWGFLLTTQPDGTPIAQQPDNVRLYAVAGSDHGGGSTGAALACRAPNSAATPYRQFLRAAMVNLEEWVARGTAPPPGIYPSLADGSLTTLDAAARIWPRIPGFPYIKARNKPEYFVQAEPLPVLRGSYPLLALTLDRDGNAVGGLRHPVIAVPTGTLSGVGGRKEGYVPQHACPFRGEFLPFAPTRAERRASGDARPSLEERYPGGTAEISAKRQAVARSLAEQRYILDEDVEAAAALSDIKPRP